MKRIFRIAGILLILSLFAPFYASGQAKINTKRVKIADLATRTTKVVTGSGGILDSALRDEVSARWRISPFEFCTVEEYNSLKENSDYYFLLVARSDEKKYSGMPPKLFAVIQGGGSFELRRRCAEELLEIGFDGFGFGGWPLDADGNLLYDILEYTRSLIPREFPIHALGIGHPENVVRCFDLGYEIFDCAMPTRDARHGRLYSFDPKRADLSGKWLKYIYISDEKHIRSDRPVMPDCDCPVCQRYSIGYLRHLFKMNDSLFPRLATIHNVRVLTRLCEILREKKYAA